MAWHGHLSRAEALEDHRFTGARKLSEPSSQVEPQPFLDDHIDVGVRAAKEMVAHIATDDPRPRAQLGRRLLEKPAHLLGGYWLIRRYWLIRAHSTAPTCPARSPSRARRRRGRRAGLMNGEERRVSSMVGATSFHERVMPPPITNISGSMAFVRLIRANPMYRADRSTTIRACLSPRAAAAKSSDAGRPVSFARLAPPQNTSRQPNWPQVSSGPLGSMIMCPISPAVPCAPRWRWPSMMSPPPTPVDQV